MHLGAPWILALLIPAALVVAWLERRLPGAPARRIARFVVRMLVLALGALALSEPTRTVSAPLERRLVVAVDRSAGMTEAARRDALETARSMVSAAGRSGVLVSLVGFSEEASNAVEVRPDGGWPEGDGSPWPLCDVCEHFRPVPHAERARLAAGLAGGRAAFGAGEAGTVLLITNGRGDAAGARSAIDTLRARGLDVAALAVPREDTPVYEGPRITALVAAETVRGTFPVRVALEDAPSGTEVELRIDGAATGDVMAIDAAGEVRFDVEGLAPGLHEIAVTMNAPGSDALARRLVRVGAPPRALAFLADPSTSPLRAALVVQGFDVVDVAPVDAEGMLAADPVTADLVVLDAASAAALPAPAQSALLERIQDGLGLMLEAGTTEEGWNALAGSAVADALAVEPLVIEALPPPPPPPPRDDVPPPEDPPEDADGPGIVAERRPEMALPITLLLVIDRSGSMTGAKLGLAVQGALRAAMALSEWDRVGVITFADQPSLDFAPRSARNAHEIPYWLTSSVAAGGGTDIFAALRLASHVLAKETAAIQHVILLTDGETGGPKLWHHVVPAMKKQGITITAIGLGPHHNRRELRQITQLAASGSRVLSVYEIGQLPTVMTRDTVELAERRSDDAERLDRLNNPDADPAPPDDPPPADPTANAPPPLPPPEALLPGPTDPPGGSAPELAPLVRIRAHEATGAFDDVDLPAVGPPRPSRLRADAAVLLARAGRDEPESVLAVRRFGLGRVVVWALPADDPGGAGWPRLGQLFGQAARSALAPEGAFRFVPRLVVHHEPDGDVLTVDWPDGESGGELSVVWRDADGREIPVARFTPNDPEPRRSLPAAAPGSLVQLIPTLTDGRPMPRHTYLAPAPALPDPSAGDQARLFTLFGQPPADATAFVRAVPGGRRERREPCGDWFLWMLVALLPIDVWLHRRGRAA